MKNFKSFIKLAAVAVAVVSMSGTLTSCEAIGDLLFDEPYYDTYHVVEYRHVPVYHDYGYYYSSPTYVPNGTVISGRR